MNADTITEARVISIDYSMSLEAMIAAGKYDWKNGNITANEFPVEGTGIIRFETKVFHFDRNISSGDAVAAIKADDPRNPWEPAKIEHLLAYGAKNPEDQRKYPIIGLGSVALVRGGCFVPCLGGSVVGRRLGIYWRGDGWDGYGRFLSVRKLSSAA